MKTTQMSIALTKNSLAPIDRILVVMIEFLDSLQHSKNTIHDNITFCREMRTNRKKFEKEIKGVIKTFHCFSEKQQSEIEMTFYRSLNKLEKIVPKVEKEIDDDHLFFVFSYFLKREMKKTLAFFRKTQSKMSATLYPDKSKEILSNPKKYQELVDTWGELAHD